MLIGLRSEEKDCAVRAWILNPADLSILPRFATKLDAPANRSCNTLGLGRFNGGDHIQSTNRVF